MTQPNVLPIGRLTPSPGLFVDRTEKSVANERDSFTWTAAHEFGHIIGLEDNIRSQC